MADIVSKLKRSEMMSGIKGKDTKPEMLIRKTLHGLGYRYTLHNKKLAGKPDLSFPRHNTVIFVNGCFWHGHSCHLFKWPSTKREFWKAKISGNIERDKKNIHQLKSEGWKVLVIWECSLKGKNKLPIIDIVRHFESFIHGNINHSEIFGHQN